MKVNLNNHLCKTHFFCSYIFKSLTLTIGPKGQSIGCPKPFFSPNPLYFAHSQKTGTLPPSTVEQRALLGHNQSTHCFTRMSSPGKLNLNFTPFVPFKCLGSTLDWRWNLMLAYVHMFSQFIALVGVIVLLSSPRTIVLTFNPTLGKGS